MVSLNRIWADYERSSGLDEEKCQSVLVRKEPEINALRVGGPRVGSSLTVLSTASKTKSLWLLEMQIFRLRSCETL
jgi:hypothetical protein